MQAIVLARRDFREYDQIISLYTKEKGKLELLARGVKKITSKNSAHLEPFSVVDIDIAQGKEIDHLTKVQPVEYFKNIRNDFQKSLVAQYVVSVTDKFMQVGERDERLFFSLKTWLEFLEMGNGKWEMGNLLDGFIVILLHCLGFSPSQNSKFVKWKTTLEILESGNWDVISTLGFDAILHKKIHNFLEYHTERHVVDWEKTFVTVG